MPEDRQPLAGAVQAQLAGGSQVNSGCMSVEFFMNMVDVSLKVNSLEKYTKSEFPIIVGLRFLPFIYPMWYIGLDL